MSWAWPVPGTQWDRESHCVQPTQQPSHRLLEFPSAGEGLWAAAPGPLSHGAKCWFYSDPRTRDVGEESRREMCSRACLPPHFCSRTREQCRSPTRNILCAALPGSALSPRTDLRAAPAGAGPRHKGAEGEGPWRPPHLACREALCLQLKCAGQTVSHQSASGRGHTTPDPVTPLLSFQHTRFKHEPGLLLGRHRAEKSRSQGKIVLNSRAHVKPIHIISRTILSWIYEENKTNITHIYFSLISQPQSPTSVCKAASEPDCSRNPPPWIPT